MKINFTIGLFAILLIACNSNEEKTDEPKITTTETTVEKTSDTIIQTRTLTTEIAGSEFRKRATAYRCIIKNDTSRYCCFFTESKQGAVTLELNISSAQAGISYKQMLAHVRAILPKASGEYNFDSLNTVSFGRLVLSGDLALAVSKQYDQKFGLNKKLGTYAQVSEFLKTSKLGTDMHELFKPYSLSVESVSIEKLFLTPGADINIYSKLDDTTNVPDKILDCITWVKLRKE